MINGTGCAKQMYSSLPAMQHHSIIDIWHEAFMFTSPKKKYQEWLQQASGQLLHFKVFCTASGVLYI